MNWEMVVYDVTPISYAQRGLYERYSYPLSIT